MCVVGSMGFMCSQCPVGFARNQYPEQCQECPRDAVDAALALTAAIFLDLLQRTVLGIITTSLAATTAGANSHGLHSSMIRIGIQWFTACSVIVQFRIGFLEALGVYGA